MTQLPKLVHKKEDINISMTKINLKIVRQSQERCQQCFMDLQEISDVDAISTLQSRGKEYPCINFIYFYMDSVNLVAKLERDGTE